MNLFNLPCILKNTELGEKKKKSRRRTGQEEEWHFPLSFTNILWDFLQPHWSETSHEIRTIFIQYHVNLAIKSFHYRCSQNLKSKWMSSKLQSMFLISPLSKLMEETPASVRVLHSNIWLFRVVSYLFLSISHIPDCTLVDLFSSPLFIIHKPSISAQTHL